MTELAVKLGDQCLAQGHTSRRLAAQGIETVGAATGGRARSTVAHQ